MAALRPRYAFEVPDISEPGAGSQNAPDRPQKASGTIALLCCGPSLPEVWSNERFDEYQIVVAVNTAAWRYKCHWLCASDAHVFAPLWGGSHPLPLLGVIANEPRGKEAKLRGLRTIPLRLQGPEWLKGTGRRPPNSVQCGFTMPNALAWCLSQTTGMIDIFGCDFSTALLDFAGQKGNHDAVRWQRESAWLRVIWEPERIRVFGRLAPSVLDYLSRRTDTFRL